MQLQHSYYRILLHMKLLLKTWLMQLMVVTVLKQKVINAHLANFFHGKLLCDCLIEVRTFCRFYYGKIVFSGNVSVVFLYLSLSLYTWIRVGCLVFAVFEKYLATRNKNLFSTTGIHSNPKYEHIWYCSSKFMKNLGGWIAHISFPEIKEKLLFQIAFSQLHNLYSLF